MFLGNIPARVSVGLMIFTGVLVSYTMRVNLSVNIVDMVPVVSNSTQGNETATLGWSAYERALVLGAYYWGYCVSNIVAGPISERFGSRIVVLITHLASGLLTLASPAAAKHSYLAMVIVRGVLGFVAGFIFPAANGLVAYWAVPFEKGKFVSAMIGGTVGTVVSWSISGVVISEFGWEWGFYVFGIFAIAWCVPWWLLIYNTPEQHPRISIKEKQYICDGIAGTYNDVKPIPPYGRILTSIPVWAVCILLFGNGWGVYFVLNAAPSFIANVLNYKIASTGFLSSLTYVARASAAFSFGLFGDFLLTRNLISLNLLRKSFCLVSHVIPGLLLLVMTITDNPTTALVLMIMSIGLNGSVTVTCAANSLDLSPNFAGSIYGLGNALSTIAGFITPLVVAFFTKDDETSFEAWQPVFYTGAGVYILTAFIFMIFGSTEIQGFNEIKSSEDVEKPKAEATLE